MATVGKTTLKPLRWPRFWLVLWLLAVALLVVVCLIPLQGLPPLPDNSDKVEHLLAYFILSASAVQLFGSRRALCWVAAGLVAMGVGIEWAQGALTATRMADPMDALANASGVLIGMLTVLTPLRDLLLRLQGR